MTVETMLIEKFCSVCGELAVFEVVVENGRIIAERCTMADHPYRHIEIKVKNGQSKNKL